MYFGLGFGLIVLIVKVLNVEILLVVCYVLGGIVDMLKLGVVVLLLVVKIIEFL